MFIQFHLGSRRIQNLKSLLTKSMEETTPQDSSNDNTNNPQNDVVSNTSSPTNKATPLSDSLDSSSDPTIPEPEPEPEPEPKPRPEPETEPKSEPRNPNMTIPQKKRRRRKKRFFSELNPNPSSSTGTTGFGRPRTATTLAKELNVEAMIAVSVGFPADSLTEEEIEANVVSKIGGSEEDKYIIVRNHIISLWRSNVSNWLSLDKALESIRAEHKGIVETAYEFLVNHGYINFGVAKEVIDRQFRLNEGVERGSVVVIGGGLAGLVAARQLMALGFKVVVLEGRARAGGRVKTRVMEGEGVMAAADLGGSVITGVNGNPLGVLARQLELPLHKVRDNCPLYLPDGRAVNKEVDTVVEVAFNKLLDRVCKLRQLLIEEVKSADVNLGTALEAFRRAYKVAENDEERMLLDWHLANLEYANATLMTNLSMVYWDQDDPYEMGGDHCFIPGGNDTFVRELAKGLPIFYEKTVDSIRYGVDGVRVYVNGQEFRSDVVLCTVPLGVLKRGSIEFVPELPQRKRDAIQRLGYGLLNKVSLLFPYNFWGGELDTFGRLSENSSMRGECFLFYSYVSVSGGPLLIALVAGDAAVRFETMSPLESVKRVLGILRGIYHPQGIVVPDPVQAVCTRWGQDRFSYGSYSYVAVGSSGDDYDILAESVGDGRVFFAGEATNRQYPATMHGAFLSGMREAANILRVINQRSSMALTNKSNNDIQESNSLNNLYENPDMTFGSFTVLFDPESKEIESNSLLRVKIENGQSDSCGLHLYGLVSKKQAMELSELVDDGERMEMLYHKFQVRLGGRKVLSSVGESLIAHVMEARSKSISSSMID